MKNPGHKRSISGYSQPSQSKYSQNSLLNTMIRVNKIGGVASNLDSSAVTNGTRPSISPYRKNSNSRETTPKTAVSRNSAQTAKSNLENLNSNGSNGVSNRNSKLNNSLNANFNFANNFSYSNNSNNGIQYGTGSKVASSTPPPLQPKRIQSSNNFAVRPEGMLKSVAGFSNNQRGNNKNNTLMSSYGNNFQTGFGFSKMSNAGRFTNSNSINDRNNNSVRDRNNQINNKDRENNIGINSLSSSNYNMNTGRNFFSKINNNNNNHNSANNNINGNSRNIASTKQMQTNQQRNLLSGLLENSLGASGLRGNRTNNNLNNNSNNTLTKNGTKITINNDNLTQKKFEKNLNNNAGGGAAAKNRPSKSNNSDNSNSALNNSFEKSATNSFNSAYDRIKVNKSALLLQQQKNKLNTLSNNNNNINLNINNNSDNTTNNNNNSNNNSNNDVLSSLLNSKNYSKSPKCKYPSPGLQKNTNLIGDLNKSPNNLNILGKSGVNPTAGYLNSGSPGLKNFSGLSSSNDLFSKIYSINVQSRKNLEISQKKGREKSKTPSQTPVSSSLNNLNILNNLKRNKNLLVKNAKNLSNNNNNGFTLKKINVLNSGNFNSNVNPNSQTIQGNNVKNNLSANNNNHLSKANGTKNNEVRGTIMEMNSEEFMNKLTGKFGGVTKESFHGTGKNDNYNNNNSRSNSNNNSQNNFNNNLNKDDNSSNLAGSNRVNDPTSMSFGKFNENINDNNSGGMNVLSFNAMNVSRDNKFMNSNNNSNNLNNSIKPSSTQGVNGNKVNNDSLSKDSLNSLNFRQIQGQSNFGTSSFKEMNTSPFLKNKSNASERNLVSKNFNLPLSVNNNIKSISNLINKSTQDLGKAAEGRNMTPNPPKTTSKLSNSNLNENRSVKESPIKTNKSVDNIIVPPKKFRKRILYMSEITKIGFSGQSNKKYNQDNYFIYKNFNNDPNSIYMAKQLINKSDGHGVHGHEVSGYLKENLPANLSKNFNKKNINLNSTNVSDPSFQGLIKETFISTNNQMTHDLRVDTNFSGSTCVSVIYTPTKLTTINVGDSRAVLGRLVNGVWTSHDLSNDHKPSEPNEAARIKRTGGRIEPYTDDNNEFIGPPRVWLKEEDIPGLAMTRSFGDKIANIVGVTCEPEITEWELTPEDKFFIIASDGVWEFIESEECVNILKDYYLKSDHKGACEHLVKEASKRWMKEEEVIDDITMIVVFLE